MNKTNLEYNFKEIYSFGQALDLLVLISYMCYHTSTFNLSTLSSSRGLTAYAWDILS
jgi:hypothetical protein